MSSVIHSLENMSKAKKSVERKPAWDLSSKFQHMGKGRSFLVEKVVTLYYVCRVSDRSRTYYTSRERESR